MDGKPKIEETTVFAPVFNSDGLLPCVTVDADSGSVLMLAWMNDAALRTTLESGVAHYWSRSRRKLWKKGETSGAIQHIVSVSIDCDQDAVLLKVRPDNIVQTCHTGRSHCFYRTIVADPSEPTGLTLRFGDSPKKD